MREGPGRASEARAPRFCDDDPRAPSPGRPGTRFQKERPQLVRVPSRSGRRHPRLRFLQSIDAQAFEEVGAQLPGAFSYEILYGDRPPRLTDFWDNAVARDVRQPAVRKVVRVRGEEFVVQG